MPNDRIAVIGDKDVITAFRALGVDVFGIKSFFDAQETLKKLAREYSIILVTEDVAAAIPDIIKRYRSRPYPAVIPIPSASGSTGYGMKGLSSDVEKAVGTDILLNDKK